MPKQILGEQSLEGCFGNLSAALGGVNPYAGQVVEFLGVHDDRAPVTVGSQQVAGMFRFVAAGDEERIPPVPAAGCHKNIKLSGERGHLGSSFVSRVNTHRQSEKSDTDSVNFL